MGRVPTDYLVQHMGNFHNYMDKYLVKNNFRILNQVPVIF